MVRSRHDGPAVRHAANRGHELIEVPHPFLYVGHKLPSRRIKADVPDERYTIPFGEARVHRDGEDVTVVTWGAMVYTADEAAEKLAEDGVSIEILDLRTVVPWDKKAVLEWCDEVDAIAARAGSNCSRPVSQCSCMRRETDSTVSSTVSGAGPRPPVFRYAGSESNG